MPVLSRSVFFFLLSGVLLFPSFHVFAAEIASSYKSPAPVLVDKSGAYYWSITPVRGTGQLLTLHCRRCARREDSPIDVPLLSVLRDTLGYGSPENDRLSYVWLLTAGRMNLGQKVLSAVPFFYWPLGSTSISDKPGYPAPLLDVGARLHPVLSRASRSILQWVAFDPLATSVRATSRSYQANQTDHERLRLEEAIDYLQNAPPVSNGNGLSEKEINTVMACLQLRKSLLGGLLSKQRVAEFGQQTRFADTRISVRNLEALRQFAEKSGTYFEPLTLAGDTSSFAMLWFAAHTSPPNTGISNKPIWKLLNIRDPWSDPTLADWHGLSVQRSFDLAGHLLAPGSSGGQAVTMVPLAVYSLNYPEMPLLLIDFRDKLHVHRNEMVQRAITEITSGVLGLSHFANWYYYAGAFVYQTVWARRGIAANQAGRLDCYAQFRMHLALDRELDPKLREELIYRAGALNVNPLDSDPARNVDNARVQYARLERAAQGNPLLRAMNRDRRAELAAFGQSAKASIWVNSLRVLSFGIYTQRVSEDERNLTNLDRDRRIAYQIDFLQSVTGNGTDPRIAYNGAQIDAAVFELTGLLANVKSPSLLQRAHDTLARVQTLSLEAEQVATSKQTIDAAVVSR